jgi:hypothetical protein
MFYIWIAFTIGFFVGAALGFALAALCQTADVGRE